MWAAHRMVSELWVVSGAPNRTRRIVRTGVAKTKVRETERRAG